MTKSRNIGRGGARKGAGRKPKPVPIPPLTDYSRVFAFTDEMKHDEQNPALDAKALRARLRYYRAQINREIGAIIAANARIE